MYRDDTCPVCGEALPPDHLYCREHAAEVDQRLHRIATLLASVARDAADLSGDLRRVAAETWDFVAEDEPDDPLWPPAPPVDLRARPDQVEVDVDSEPGFVRVRLQLELAELLEAIAQAVGAEESRRFAQACAAVEGAGATH